MLNSINLNDKSYEDFFSDAVSQIPLYSSEWDNFNVSDPGITVLQNLSAFAALQQSEINTVTDEIKLKLLKLVGVTPQSPSAQKTLVQYRGSDEKLIPPYSRFISGNCCFEAESSFMAHADSLCAVYCNTGDNEQNIYHLVSGDARTSAYAFGENPKPGSRLILAFKKPLPTDEDFQLYFKISNSAHRNPVDSESFIDFAKINWEYYTQSGWQRLEYSDKTYSLVVDGAITLHIKKQFTGALLQDYNAYCIRAVLQSTKYDISPKIQYIQAFVHTLSLKKTMGVLYKSPFKISFKINMAPHILQNIMIFLRNDAGGYRLLLPSDAANADSGTCVCKIMPDGSLKTELDNNALLPCHRKDNNAIVVLCFDDELGSLRNIGMLYGYDNQEIELSFDAVADTSAFSLMLKQTDEDGNDLYYFFEPEDTNEGAVNYCFSYNCKKIIIKSCGAFDAGELFIADLAVMPERFERARAQNLIKLEGSEENFCLETVTQSFDGSATATVDELCDRFAAMIKNPKCAVRPQDIEKLVLQVPSLCIHKAKAIACDEQNAVKIFVKPHLADSMAPLSEDYKEQIEKALEPYRILTTRYEILSAGFAAVDVTASVYVHSYYADSKQLITQALLEALDYVNTPKPFVRQINKNEIIKTINGLDCVQALEKLTLIPISGCKADGENILPDDGFLCYGRNITLHIISKGK